MTLGPWRASGWGWLPEETTEIGGWNVSPTPNFTEGRRAAQLVSSVLQSYPALCDPWTATHQASLLITNSRGLLKLMSIELVMPSNHLILCCPLLLLPSIFLRIRIFSSESVLHIRWPKYWSFNVSISPSNEYSGLISFRIDGVDLLAV